jgi:ribosomal protein L30E
LEFRQSLRIDISNATRALANAEWKAATVLAGSVVEALLLWALLQRPTDIPKAIAALLKKGTLGKDPGTNLESESWVLHVYIEVAAELNVIKTDTATQARLAKNFRNLIHPGRTLRLGQVCNRGTALSALAAVEHVVGDLTPKTP